MNIFRRKKDYLPPLPAASSLSPPPLTNRKNTTSNKDKGNPPTPPPLETPVNIVPLLQQLSLQSDRPKLLAALKLHAAALSCIPLPPPMTVDASQAVKDLLRERLVLNGIPFLGQGSLFLETLRRLSRLLCCSESVNGSAGEKSGAFVTDAILTRCARTTSGSDSYFTVTTLLGNPSILLKPRTGVLPPIDIEVFVSNGRVQAAVCSTNMYSFYRLEDIEVIGDRVEDFDEKGKRNKSKNKGKKSRKSMSDGNSGNNGGRKNSTAGVSDPAEENTAPNGAWLNLDTVVVEKIDFGTGRSLRFLRIEVPERVDDGEGGSF